MATKKQEATSVAFVLCAGSFDGSRRFDAGVVVEGIPAEVLEGNRHWLDPVPAAVDVAKAAGAPVLTYRE